MRSITVKMLKIYNMKEIDFMGYRLLNPEYHHIKKREDGGKLNIRNGAILSKNSHEFLHNAIEEKDKALFIYLNILFKYENIYGIDEEIIRIIHEELDDFYEKYKDEYNNRGEKLIKEHYMAR